MTLAVIALAAGCTTSQNQLASTAAEEAAEAAAQAAMAALVLTDPPNPDSHATGSPMGVLCWAAILESVSDTGKRCMGKEDPQFRTALDRSIARLDAHLTTAGGWSEAQLNSFKAKSGWQAESDAEVCGDADALQMYQGLQQAGSAPLDRQTSAVIANPGPPKWGDCL